MKKLAMVVTALCCADAVSAQEVDVSLHYLSTVSHDISDTERVKLRVGAETFYLWSAYSQHTQRGKTQLMGRYQNLSGGIGFKRNVWKSLDLYGEFGVIYYNPKLSERVTNEVVYYTFYEIFGEPPFQEGWWDTLEQKYEVERFTPAINVGARFKIMGDISMEVEYSYAETEAYFATWNPTWRGGPVAGNYDACGCYWEGFQTTSFSGVSVGFNYRF